MADARPHPASPQKLAMADRAGVVPRSPLVPWAGALLAIALVTPTVVQLVQPWFRDGWGRAAALAAGPPSSSSSHPSFGGLLLAVALLVVAAAVGALLAEALQRRGRIGPRRSPRDLSVASASAADRAMRAVGGGLAAGAAVLVVAAWLHRHAHELPRLLTEGDATVAAAALQSFCFHLAAVVAMGAVVDLALAVWQRRRQLRMSDRERRDAWTAQAGGGARTRDAARARAREDAQHRVLDGRSGDGAATVSGQPGGQVQAWTLVIVSPARACAVAGLAGPTGLLWTLVEDGRGGARSGVLAEARRRGIATVVDAALVDALPAPSADLLSAGVAGRLRAAAHALAGPTAPQGWIAHEIE